MAKTKTKAKLGRHDLPVALVGATEFSDDRDALSPLQVVRLLKQHPEIVDDLLEQTTVVHEGRKKRLDGSWALAFLAFTCSDAVDMEPWWTASIDTKVWEECGFDGRPAFNTMYDRFVEMEKLGFEEHFRRAAYKLIQRARKHSGGLVGRDIHIDSTEAETNARLVHVCGPKCPKRKEEAKRGPALLPDRLDTKQVRGIRHQHSAKAAPPEDEQQQLDLGEAREVHVMVDEHTGREYLLVKAKWGCWYRSYDTTAGARAYNGKHGAFRYWHGFYNVKSVDHYTGAPLDVFVMNASIVEHQANDTLVDRIKEATGSTPRALCYDKGFSVKHVYERNTSEGIATVAPWRGGRWGNRANYDCDRYDRHGIPRCRHCQGEGRFVSFTLSPKPRLIYACALGCPESKGKRMSINCDEHWRFLVPLWRNTEAYLALRRANRHYKEGVHRYWRQRYGVGGENFYTRPKRIGVAWQQLRASAALLAEWLKISWREGWLGSPRRNKNGTFTNRAAQNLADFLLYRTKLALNQVSEGQTIFVADETEAPPEDEGPPDDGGPPGFVLGDDFPF